MCVYTGSMELENLKQQAYTIQADLSALQPTIDEQGQNVQSQLRLLSKNVASMREQIGTIAHVCQELQQRHLHGSSSWFGESVTSSNSPPHYTSSMETLTAANTSGQQPPPPPQPPPQPPPPHAGAWARALGGGARPKQTKQIPLPTPERILHRNEAAARSRGDVPGEDSKVKAAPVAGESSSNSVLSNILELRSEVSGQRRSSLQSSPTNSIEGDTYADSAQQAPPGDVGDDGDMAVFKKRIKPHRDTLQSDHSKDQLTFTF